MHRTDDDPICAVVDMLEGSLAPVNRSSALRLPLISPGSQVRKGMRREQTEARMKKSEHEKMKRDEERHHLERMSYMFRAPTGSPEGWTRVDILSFGKIFSLIGLVSNKYSHHPFQLLCSFFAVPVPFRRTSFGSRLTREQISEFHFYNLFGIEYIPFFRLVPCSPISSSQLVGV